MKKVGIIGWRGMVGSILMQRMKSEGDFSKFQPTYFGASAASMPYVDVCGKERTLVDANSIEHLAEMHIVISCQGSDYTQNIYPRLRATGWQGYWIDAASALRMNTDSVIVLDPVNREQIDRALTSGCRNFIGGNCSITLTLLGLAGLFHANLIDWMSVMTYQAASGAGAAYVRELLKQIKFLSGAVTDELTSDKPITALLDRAQAALVSSMLPLAQFRVPLVGSIISWIDSDLGNGSSREEWKGEVETNKLLGLNPGSIRVDGLCVRVGVLRCHSAAVTMQLKRDISLAELETLISSAHEWVEFVPNTKSATLERLSPVALSGSLKVGVGRLKKLSVGRNMYSVFTVGDQLLWGAAEPLRRVLNIILEHKSEFF